MKVYDNFLNNEDKIEILAKEIVEAFQTKASSETIDYNFDISAGKIKTIEPNTNFTFDPDENSELWDLKTSLFGEDLSDITEEEENKLIEDTREYLRKLGIFLINNYSEEIRNVLRNTILAKTTKEDFPMETIVISSIDISDYSSISEPKKYTIKIGKMPDTYINTEKVVNFIHDTQSETGKTAEEVFQQEKNNKILKDVTSIETGHKYIYDIGISMFVDYSMGNCK